MPHPQYNAKNCCCLVNVDGTLGIVITVMLYFLKLPAHSNVVIFKHINVFSRRKKFTARTFGSTDWRSDRIKS